MARVDGFRWRINAKAVLDEISGQGWEIVSVVSGQGQGYVDVVARREAPA